MDGLDHRGVDKVTLAARRRRRLGAVASAAGASGHGRAARRRGGSRGGNRLGNALRNSLGHASDDDRGATFIAAARHDGAGIAAAGGKTAALIAIAIGAGAWRAADRIAAD